MRILAVHLLNSSRDPSSDGGEGFAAHAEVLSNDGLVVENLRGATGLPQQCENGFFQFKRQWADGAPGRAAAWTEA